MTDTPNPVRAWRARLGWTIDRAAAELEVHRATLIRYEQRTPPKVVRLACAAVECRIDPIRS